MSDVTSDEVRAALRPYLQLSRRFVAGDVSAEHFEREYQAAYLADDCEWPLQLFDVLDGIFAASDDYVSDERLRRTLPDSLDEAQLRRHVATALAGLEEIAAR